MTGIGFLGAGAIIRQGLDVRGLTTAASLWTAAAIGMASGAGYLFGAALTTLVVLLALHLLRVFRGRVIERFRVELGNLTIVFEDSGESVSEAVRIIEDHGIAVRAMDAEIRRARRATTSNCASRRNATPKRCSARSPRCPASSASESPGCARSTETE